MPMDGGQLIKLYKRLACQAQESTTWFAKGSLRPLRKRFFTEEKPEISNLSGRSPLANRAFLASHAGFYFDKATAFNTSFVIFNKEFARIAHFNSFVNFILI